MKAIIPLFTLLVFIFIGCSSSVHTSLAGTARPPLPENAEIMVLQTYQKQPDSCIKLGEFHIGDNGFSTDCGYNKVIEAAKAVVRKAGGNILNITTFTGPGFSTCYRLTADILYRPHLVVLLNRINSTQDSITKVKFHGATNYAILNVYRPLSLSGAGGLISYNVRIKDSVIFRAKKGSRGEVKLYKEGKTTIWGETETKDSVTIDVKFGQEYFLRSDLQMGALVGEPILILMDKPAGRMEFESVKPNK
jgi:hypothetical protein